MEKLTNNQPLKTLNQGYSTGVLCPLGVWAHEQASAHGLVSCTFLLVEQGAMGAEFLRKGTTDHDRLKITDSKTYSDHNFWRVADSAKKYGSIQTSFSPSVDTKYKSLNNLKDTAQFLQILTLLLMNVASYKIFLTIFRHALSCKTDIMRSVKAYKHICKCTTYLFCQLYHQSAVWHLPTCHLQCDCSNHPSNSLYHLLPLRINVRMECRLAQTKINHHGKWKPNRSIIHLFLVIQQCT